MQITVSNWQLVSLWSRRKDEGGEGYGKRPTWG